MSSPPPIPPSTPDPPGAGARPPGTLARLGAESDAARSAKTILPWIVSTSLHALVVALGFLLTWTVVQWRERESPIVVADFDAVTYEPVVAAGVEMPVSRDEPMPDRLRVDASTERIAEQLARLEIDPTGFLAEAAAATPGSAIAPRVSEGAASFVGLSVTNAKRIVYVIDASGSMIASLQFVLDELARSLDGLSPQQSFGIVFFQRNEALVVPPADRLVPATDREVVRALDWTRDHVIPSGRSNPVAAIEAAMRLEPDAIFLLSENITGLGEFEIDQRDLLALLDEVNPLDPATGGRRTQINCIQFLEPDPLNTLRLIAERHGGPRAYKFLDRAELGLGR